MRKYSFRKIILFTGILFAFVLGTFTSCNSKEIKLGFCDIPQNVQQSIITQLSESYDLSFSGENISIIDEKNAKKISSKYDLIFTWKGSCSDQLQPFAVSYASDLENNFPSSYLRNFSTDLPILLNHYGLSYNLIVKSRSRVRYPNNFDDLEKFIKKESSKVSYPIFIAGSDNKELLAFVSVLCESLTGSEGYKKFIKALKNYSSMDTFLETQLSSSRNINSVLSVLLDWRKAGYLPLGWTEWTKADLRTFTTDNKIGVAFMSLEDYRNLPPEAIKNLACDRFPVKENSVNHSIIAPSIVCTNVSKKLICKELQASLIDPNVQKNISKVSGLAPSEKSTQACDKQADDVRYLAAACLGGPVTSAYNELESDSEKLSKFCNDLRLFLNSR